MNAVLSGPLSKGGILSENAESNFTVDFACLPMQHAISSVEIILKFGNNDVLSLYFQKECKSVGNLTVSYSFLSTIYFIFVIILLMFSAGVAYYFYLRNRILIKDTITKLIQRITNKYQKREKSDTERLNYYASFREASYEENDLVDAKIKTELNSNSINTKYDSI
jgi:hypothetical protein